MTTMIYVDKPAEEDLTAVQGANIYDHFYIRDENDIAVDITGWKARFALWPVGSPVGTTPSLAMSESSGITLVGATGEVTIKSTLVQSRALPIGEYDYQEEFEDAAGAVQTYKIGVLTMLAEVAQ